MCAVENRSWQAGVLTLSPRARWGSDALRWGFIRRMRTCPAQVPEVRVQAQACELLPGASLRQASRCPNSSPAQTSSPCLPTPCFSLHLAPIWFHLPELRILGTIRGTCNLAAQDVSCSFLSLMEELHT